MIARRGRRTGPDLPVGHFSKMHCEIHAFMENANDDRPFVIDDPEDIVRTRSAPYVSRYDVIASERIGGFTGNPENCGVYCVEIKVGAGRTPSFGTRTPYFVEIIFGRRSYIEDSSHNPAVYRARMSALSVA